jgi:ABC-2 type transport system ATP-binding protein
MSGLDPLGRRDVRALILELRDRGCTIFFSSHILSDAEALCHRVGILVGGQLVAAGRLTDIVALQVTGWELVMAHLPPGTEVGVQPDVVRVTPVSDGQFVVELRPDAEPERLMAALRGQGGRVVSLTPLRKTLEDVFVEHVVARRAHPPAGRTVEN